MKGIAHFILIALVEFAIERELRNRSRDPIFLYYSRDSAGKVADKL